VLQKLQNPTKSQLPFFQAFGVGAFEEDDEDIYGREDLSQYDFSLDTETTTSKQKHRVTEPAFANYAGNILIGFLLGTNATARKKHFPPPGLPRGFEPVHGPRKSRFEPAPTETKGKESLKPRKKGVERHNLTAADRAMILSESTPQLTVQRENIISTTHEENEGLPTGDLKTKETSEISVTGGYSQFRPFVANPEKQKRYEEYLTLSKLGQKGTVDLHMKLSKRKRNTAFNKTITSYFPI
jgi:G patch domain-containing protein 1